MHQILIEIHRSLSAVHLEKPPTDGGPTAPPSNNPRASDLLHLVQTAAPAKELREEAIPLTEHFDGLIVHTPVPHPFPLFGLESKRPRR
jgi:hypothetical protein